MVPHHHLIRPTPVYYHCDDGWSLRSPAPLLQAPLDHFDATNKATFPLRYYIDDSVFDAKDGALFIEMGGEGPCGGVGTTALHKQHKAMAIAIEHRFYGGGSAVYTVARATVYRAVRTLQSSAGDNSHVHTFHKRSR